MSDFSYIQIIILIGIGFYLFQKFKNDESENAEYLVQKRKQELKTLLEQRKTRDNQQLFDEQAFWELMENLDFRSNGSYKNQLGLFKDYLRKLSPEQLLEIDNLFNHLIRKATNWDVVGATFIIFKSYDAHTVNLFISWLISKGEGFFNHSIIDVDHILKEEIIDLTQFSHSDIIADVYYAKTNELMPLTPEENHTVGGTEWQQQEVPSRFKKLWDAYA